MFKKRYRPFVLIVGIIIALLIYGNSIVEKPEASVNLSLEQPSKHGYLILFTDVVELTAKHMLFLKEKSN